MNWQYHPQEVIWRPRGETGLGRALAARLHADYPTAWVGHGAAFETCAEALAVPELGAKLIFTGRQSLWNREGHPDLGLQKSLLQGFDLAVVEGLVDSEAPWIVELDDGGKGMEDIPPSSLRQVVALVGTCGPVADLPPGGIPRFPPTEIDDLAHHLLDVLEQAGRARPIHGLLLATGDDSASGREAAIRALNEVCDRIWSPLDDDTLRRAGVERLESNHPSWGQSGQILSIQERTPEAAIVTLEASSEQAAKLDRLLESRDVLTEATAFHARETHMPNPGCAVWEPRSRQRILSMLSLDVACLRRTLVAAGTKLVEGP